VDGGGELFLTILFAFSLLGEKTAEVLGCFDPKPIEVRVNALLGLDFDAALIELAL